jgi:tetratricopeptide (TPR) repeat protein
LSTRTVAIVAAVIALGGFAAVLVSGSRPEEAPAASAPVPLAVPAAAAERSGERTAPSAAPAGGVTPAAFRAVEASRAGVAAYSRGDVAGSVERFSAAVDTDPENADALNNLGQVLVRTGRAREAIPYFDRAMALAGDTWEYRFNRARAHAELQEWGRAIADYREADRLFPNDYVTAFNLAKALHASGDPARAASEFERAIALAPDQTDFHLSHGIALEAAGRPRDAAAAYRRYLELEQAAPEAETITARIAQLEGPAEPLTP